MKRILIILLSLVIAGAVLAGFIFFNALNNPVTEVEKEVYVYPNMSIADLKNSLVTNEKIENPQYLSLISKVMNWEQGVVKPGHYLLNLDMTTRDMINMFKSGRQQPVELTFQGVRKIEDLAGIVGSQLMMDSMDFYTRLMAFDWDQSKVYKPEDVLSLFIPNTYELYWTISPEDLIERMMVENNKFWTDKRKEQANQLGFDQREIYTIASIVEKESNHSPERPIIAKLYLNRLNMGIPLQADPTVVFANNQFDLRRVLHKHLEKDSPYNTYKYAGLPPGPICMPSINSIDAVLSPADVDYIYMCAKPNHPGQHDFATTLVQHNRNAAAYHRWLNTQGIK